MDINRYKETRIIATTSIALNLLLAGLKLLIGFLTNSMSMIADGLNNSGDVFSSLMTMVGNFFAGRPSDDEHPYGHGKAEYIFSQIISFSMLLIAYKMLTSSFESILHSQHFEYSNWLIIISIAAIAVKLYIRKRSFKAGRLQDNLMLIAMSEDCRNDILTSVAVMVGSLSGLIGFFWVDGIMGIAISLWIAYSGLRIFAGAYNVLMDTDINSELKQDFELAIAKIDGVDHIDSIMARPVGVNFVLIVKVSVNGDMSVNESHKIAGIIRKNMKCRKRVTDVIVHINPV